MFEKKEMTKENFEVSLQDADKAKDVGRLALVTYGAAYITMEVALKAGKKKLSEAAAITVLVGGSVYGVAKTIEMHTYRKLRKNMKYADVSEAVPFEGLVERN